MSWKRLFSKSLAPGRLHFAAHSHHLWPDASFAGQVEAWEDAARLADGKWDRVMGEVWLEAQAHAAAELKLPDPSTIVFAPNTHALLIRIASAIERRPVRILAGEGEFHSFRRQASRWEEAGLATVTRADDPAGAEGVFDLIWVSQVRFGDGGVLGSIDALARLARPEGPLVVVDGYHAFMAVSTDLSTVADRIFYVAGGYKYAMAGEGVAFAHCPPGCAQRPVVTGWYAEFDDLSLPPGAVGYAKDARRLLGATFDPSGLYRFNAVRRMLDGEGLTTMAISEHVARLQRRALELLEKTPIGAMALLNPLGDRAHARFLAFRSSHAPTIHAALAARGVVTDVRGDVLRIGFGLYHDAADVDRLAAIAGDLGG
ncbi:MAG: aminotransferase class V-fold PLP-dependent enzyme [Sphingomonadaceae bacterium]|nr:aminotransferase class V-fold PLP-dependent enzyme [Sphingomonadaceae bacterium]